MPGASLLKLLYFYFSMGNHISMLLYVEERGGRELRLNFAFGSRVEPESGGVGEIASLEMKIEG